MDTDERRLDPDEQGAAPVHRDRRRLAGVVEISLFAVALLVVGFLGARHVGTADHATATGASITNGPVSPTVSPAEPLTLETVSLDGSAATPIQHAPPDVRAATLSPDGRTLAFISWSMAIRTDAGFCGGCSDAARLYTRPIDGRAARMFEVPGPGPRVDSPAWSPDGSQLAFVRYVDGRHARVGVVDANGRHTRFLTVRSGDPGYPSWSPDGSSIAYADRADIWLVPSGGGSPTRLTSSPASDDQPTFSNTSRIAFTKNSSIWIMDGDGSEAHMIPGIPAGDTSPR